MSSEERTKNWLIANMGQGETQYEEEADPGIPAALSIDQTMENNLIYDMNQQSAMISDETGSTGSLEQHRRSPSFDDDGPQSIDTQSPDQIDNLESSRITSTWITTGALYSEEDAGVYIPVDVPLTDVCYDTDVAVGPMPEAFYNTETDVPTAPFSSPTSYSHRNNDIFDEKAISGLCGLANLGNTCFMSAGLQCLFNTPSFAQYFLLRDVSVKRNDALVHSFSKLIHKIWSGKFSSIRPSEFKEVFGRQYRDFVDFRQHDCQEFITLLLESLHKRVQGEATVFFRGRHAEKERASPSPTSPLSPSQYKSELKMEIPEECAGIDSGAASPKSSISSSSVDVHLMNMRKLPIPEEVKNSPLTKSVVPVMLPDDVSSSGVYSSHDTESVHSDVSETCDAPTDMQYCDKNNCDMDDSPPQDSEVMSRIEEQPVEEDAPCDRKVVNIEDFIKDSKTSNVNVLVRDAASNNQLVFDSEKYSKCDTKRKKFDLQRPANKRSQDINLIVNKLDINFTKENYKRIRLEEKNVQYEMAKSYFGSNLNGTKVSFPGCDSSDATTHHRFLNDDMQKLSEESWKNIFADGPSMVVDLFYGQFLSRVVCSVCNYTSSKIDPFTTLSVPLPHANEIQLPVTYVPSEDRAEPIRCSVTVSKISTVKDIREEVKKVLEIDCNSEDLYVTEVFDNHVAKILGPMARTVDINQSRQIYLFHVTEDAAVERGIKEMEDSEEDRKICKICLEELACSELRTHDYCHDCILCEDCVQMSCTHHNGIEFPCPVCNISLKPENLITVSSSNIDKQEKKYRKLLISIVFRIDTESSDNNKRESQLFGHPMLLSLRSRINCDDLREIIKKHIRTDKTFQILRVDGKGYNCSRCLFNMHCRGCPYKDNFLSSESSLCVRFTHIDPEERTAFESVRDNPSYKCLRQKKVLTIYDCLRKFSQSEILENSESWKCSKCKKKQEATKTITVYKYPPILIIHLERFLFHGTTSTKLDDRVLFPIDGLNLSDFSVNPESESLNLTYNLYGCVCHSGGVDSGHYTAVVKNPIDNDWHCFNDETVTKRKPGEDEFSSSYILFYSRQGLNVSFDLPSNFMFCENNSKIMEASSSLMYPSSPGPPRPHCSPSNIFNHLAIPNSPSQPTTEANLGSVLNISPHSQSDSESKVDTLSLTPQRKQTNELSSTPRRQPACELAPIVNSPHSKSSGDINIINVISDE